MVSYCSWTTLYFSYLHSSLCLLKTQWGKQVSGGKTHCNLRSAPKVQFAVKIYLVPSWFMLGRRFSRNKLCTCFPSQCHHNKMSATTEGTKLIFTVFRWESLFQRQKKYGKTGSLFLLPLFPTWMGNV